ncbi:MAG: hypothetical protein JNL83_04765 [Myxococcales bacterium]|nr:hypothetical protein [Myxococcales bacterium]
MRRFVLLRLSLLLLVAAAPGCTLYFGDEEDGGGSAGGGSGGPGGGGLPDGSFDFVKTRSIAGEYPIVGIDTDRAGGLWIAYQIRNGDYYKPDTTRVVHHDANGVKDKEFVYTDEYTNVSGLAFSGDAVWLNYGNWDASSGNLHVRKLDPVTGARLGSFGLPHGIIDLDVYQDELRLSYEWNEVISLDLATGGENWRQGHTLFEDGGTQRGLATTADGNMWIASWITSTIYLVDPAFDILAKGHTKLLDGFHSIDAGVHLAWDGTELILALDGQITWLAPKP